MVGMAMGDEGKADLAMGIQPKVLAVELDAGGIIGEHSTFIN